MYVASGVAGGPAGVLVGVPLGLVGGPGDVAGAGPQLASAVATSAVRNTRQ
jgi:hypothetical protein